MKTKIKELPRSKIEILGEMPWEEFQPFAERAFQELNKGLTLKGFRPGKAPRDLAERHISKAQILEEAANIALEEKYAEAVRKHRLHPIGMPQGEVLKLAHGNPFCFRVRADVLPEIFLPDYKEIASETKKKEIEVEEREIKEALEFLQRSRASFEEVKKPAQKGDFVEIEYQSPEVEQDRPLKDIFFLGNGHLIEGFEKQLEGMKAGEEKEFELTFPADWIKKELAGKKATFKVKMNKVQLAKLPPLNDGLAKELGGFKDLEALKINIKQGIRREKEIKESQRWREEVLKKIAEKTSIEIPETLLVIEQKRTLEELKQTVKEGLKMEFDDYLKQINKKEEDLKQELLKTAETRIKHLLLLQEIGSQEKIEVSDEEISQALNSLQTSYPQRSPQEIDKENLRGIIYNERVFKALESF